MNIKPGDILLFRPNWWDVLGHIIEFFSQRKHCHVGIAVNSDEIIEMGPEGLKKRKLRSYERITPYYASTPTNVYLLEAARDALIKSWEYNYVGCLHQAILELGDDIIADLDKVSPTTPDGVINCSQFVGLMWYKVTGEQMVPGKSWEALKPSDIVDSPFITKRGQDG